MHPAAEGVALREEVVVFHAPPGIQPLQGLLIRHAAVDKKVVWGDHDLRMASRKASSGAKCFRTTSRRAAVSGPFGVQPCRPAHLDEQAPLPPYLQIVVIEGVLHRSRFLRELSYQVICSCR